MKKYILLIVGVAFMLTACTNDNIPVTLATNFKIDPSSVIKTFSYEIQPGELESFDTDYKLRVRLLIYDSAGLLEAQETQYLTNYSGIMNTSVNLPEGSYMALAITDVVKYSGSSVTFEHWTLSGEDKLVETKISDAGYIGYKYKILGVSNQSFAVGGSSATDVNMKVLPAGALYCIIIKSIHQYSGVKRYSLLNNKSSDYCVFNGQGLYDVAVDNNNGSFDWRTFFLEPDKYPNSTNIYAYNFKMPIGQIGYKFTYELVSAPDYDYNDLTDVFTINAKAGDEWYIELDLAENTCEYELINKSKAANSPVMGNSQAVSAHNGELFLKDFIKK